MNRILTLVRRFRTALVSLLMVLSGVLSLRLLQAFEAGDAKWDVWRHRAGEFWSWTPFIHPPGYGEFLRAVQHLAESQGSSEIAVALRLSGVLTALLVPLVAWGLSRELGASGWVVGGAALVAISPSFLRPFENYPLAVLLTTVSILAMLEYAREGGFLRWVPVPLLVLASVELHLNCWFLLGPAMAMWMAVSYTHLTLPTKA